MSRTRRLILLLGPLPILAVSVWLSNWMTRQQSFPPAANTVFGLPRFTAVAQGEENPTRRSESAAPRRQTDDGLADVCQDSARRLKNILGEDAPVVVRPPFVIAGDLDRAQLEDWYDRTIHPAAAALANSYFKASPTQPITVLLFPGETSYNDNAKKLFGDHGISVYGYYKPQNRTLVMNIGTGGGTLVHELTHALVDFDFPDVPDWFNEGLASLHEQCRFREGEAGAWVEGLVNWRLTGLQQAIRAKRVRPLKTMIEADDFRGELEGANYAQARYLCLYLQRRGLLATFYGRFRAAHPIDPQGVKTLEEVLEIQSWSTLDRDFQQWVLTLKR